MFVLILAHVALGLLNASKSMKVGWIKYAPNDTLARGVYQSKPITSRRNLPFPSKIGKIKIERAVTNIVLMNVR